MGGPGSGNFYRSRRKATVEESLSLSMREFRGRLFSGAAGTIRWTWASGRTASVGYVVTWDDDSSGVTLDYRRDASEPVRYFVRVEMTPTQFAGRRWWFTCPLAVNGRPCRRRAGKLFLPPGGRYFGCRACHDLTYRSCQDAHRGERLFASLGFGPDAARLFLKRTYGRDGTRSTSRPPRASARRVSRR